MSLVRFRLWAPYAGLAHLVERHLAKVEVASSSLVARSMLKQDIRFGCPVFSSDEENSLPPPVREAHIKSEVRQGSCESPQAVRGMSGSEFEPRSPLQDVLMKDAAQKTPHESAAFSHIMRHF